ncbi:hypothetical protein [Candidatus Nitrotoga sp. AM1P]|uniref:hypothetical protein n=1 Tax=Candidatus Nitrotoga sp. AM1P TaxID=2559597 RepID=UPI0018E0A9EC|nr:hypothetical protein [Candidatus Nitrotoga sp. AM1P]
MTNSREVQTPHDSLEMRLTTADDRIRLSDWTPPQAGVVPRLHIGKRWMNALWIVPIVTANLIVCVAVCQELRAIPGHTCVRAHGLLRLSLVAAPVALLQFVLYGVHHPRGYTDPH